MCTEIYDLKLNFQESPIIDITEELFFSWKLNSNVSGNFQRQYEIFLKLEDDIIWRSGITISNETLNIPYSGPELKKEMKYKWFVVITTTQDKKEIKSLEQTFYTICDWNEAQWITYKGNSTELYPVFSSSFSSNEMNVAQGLLYISSLGVYDAEINGNKVTGSSFEKKEVLNPGWTDYLTQINYQCFDITNLLKNENYLSVGIGNGWFLGDISKNSGYDQLFENGEKKHALILKVVLRYSNGSIKTFCSNDKNWEITNKPEILANDLYQGEVIDYTAKNKMDSIGAIVPELDQKLVKQKLVPNNSVKIFQHFDQRRIPVESYYYDQKDVKEKSGLKFGYYEKIKLNDDEIVIKPGKKYIFDFGQNSAATFQIRFVNISDTHNKMKIRTAEMINDGVKDSTKKNFGSDGPKNSIYTKNLNFEAGGECRSEEILLFDTSSEIEYVPSYTIHGYRCLEVSATSEVKVLQIYQIPVSSLTESQTLFRTNNQAVNRLFENTLWSQKSNYMSLPTDCPQRSERVGWTGDVQIFLKTALRNFDSVAFLSEYLKSINSNKDSTLYKSIIPKAFVPILSEIVSSGWSDIGVILPWELYVFTGNKVFLKDYYGRMNRYMKEIGPLNSHENMYSDKLFGDWLSFAPASLPYMNLVYRCYCSYIMKQVANILEDKKMEKEYDFLFELIKAYIQDEYVEDGDNGFKLLTRTKDNVEKSYHGYDYVDNAQTGLLWFLKLKLYKDEQQKKLAVKELVKSIENRNGEFRKDLPEKSLSVGFLGINVLLPVLAEVDEMNLAYDLLLSEDIPSWLYSVNNGATTIWERWNSYSLSESFGDASMNSFNHYSYGSVFEWVYNHVVGVEVNLNKEHPIEIYPKIDKGSQYNNQERINEVRYEYDSIIGKIKVEWKSDGKIMKEIKVSVPMNQKGILFLKKEEVMHMDIMHKKDLDVTELKDKDGTQLLKIKIEANTVHLN